MIPTIAQLDELVASVQPKTPIMPDGVRRWIPAAVPMSDDGATITPQFIADMAAKVNVETVSIPIDGGAMGSVAHMDAPTRATGWVHRAAVVDGGLYLEAEVRPDVAMAIEMGDLAYSSIDADYQIDETGQYVPGSARLVTHALTNTPRNRGIAPMQAVHSVERRNVAHAFTRARLAQETSMSKKTETAQADTKAADVKAEETKQADAPAMTLEEAMKKIAELETKLAAMEATSAEMSAQLAASVQATERITQESAAQKLEAECASVIDEAIRCGQVAPASREKFMALARKSLETVKASLESIPKRAVRVVKAAEVKAELERGQALTEDEQHLATQLRAGGLTEAKVKATIEARRARKVV